VTDRFINDSNRGKMVRDAVAVAAIAASRTIRRELATMAGPAVRWDQFRDV